MSKFIKEMIISEIAGRFEEHRDLLVIDKSRLDAISDNKFRLELEQKGIYLLTVKNTLARKALEELGVSGLKDVLSGPSTLVWGGEDVVGLAKTVTKWAKEVEEVEVKGGSVEGTTLDSEGVEKLSKSPGRAELIGKIAGLLLAPGAQLAGAMLGPGGIVSGQLKSLAEKEGGEEEAA